jgi:hypothetical protein
MYVVDKEMSRVGKNSCTWSVDMRWQKIRARTEGRKMGKKMKAQGWWLPGEG